MKATLTMNGKGNPRFGRIPLHFKIIIIVQAAVILAFTVGMYQDYLDNLYLQEYVLSIFTANLVADVALSIVTVSMFAVCTFTLLGSVNSARQVGKEWRVLAEPAKEEVQMAAMPTLKIAEGSLSANRKVRKSRNRRPRIDNHDLFHSMTQYAAGTGDSLKERQYTATSCP